MRKEDCEHIKKTVYENLAYSSYGRVSLSHVCRLFSHLGTRADIEKCLDELCKDKATQKRTGSRGTFYVIEQIALEFGAKWKEELLSLQKQEDNLKKEIQTLQKGLNHIDELRESWLQGWSEILRDQNLRSSVESYISSIFFDQLSKGAIGELREKGNTLEVLASKIRTVRQRLDGSYES